MGEPRQEFSVVDDSESDADNATLLPRLGLLRVCFPGRPIVSKQNNSAQVLRCQIRAVRCIFSCGNAMVTKPKHILHIKQRCDIQGSTVISSNQANQCNELSVYQGTHPSFAMQCRSVEHHAASSMSEWCNEIAREAEQCIRKAEWPSHLQT